ncbi:AMP-binding protein [Shimia isoporae]|nr:AMP-binding protein [Shimia isoporae]
MIRYYGEANYPFDLPSVDCYETFVSQYQPTSKDDLRAMSQALISAGHLTGCYVVATSGSTEAPVIMGSKILHGATEDSYPYQARMLLEEHIFSATDVAANLLTPGCFGQNYEGMCRVLEAIGATILPVGKMETMDDPKTLLSLLSTFECNTIVGSPTVLIQLAHLCLSEGVNLPIRKAVFMGEALPVSKRRFLGSIWPGLRILSVYGASELGFIGVNTPELPEREHIVLSKWFFFEIDADGSLLVTDLKCPMLPIIRYRIGDRARLVTHEVGPRLVLDGRCDRNFSLGGKRVNIAEILEVMKSQDQAVDDLQITLSTDTDGRDIIKVACSSIAAVDETRCREAVSEIPAIKVAVSRRICAVEVTGEHARFQNARGKIPILRDIRESYRETHMDRVGGAQNDCNP